MLLNAFFIIGLKKQTKLHHKNKIQSMLDICTYQIKYLIGLSCFAKYQGSILIVDHVKTNVFSVMDVQLNKLPIYTIFTWNVKIN